MKWLQWMSRTFFITVLATVVSLVTTWVMVDLYAEQILRKFNLDDLRQNVQLFDVIGYASQSKENDEKKNDDDENVELNNQESEKEADHEDDAESDQYTPKDAVAVWGQASNLNEIVMSADEFNRAKDEMNAEDKMKVFSVLSNYMTDELMMQLSVMMEGGLTRGELIELENMMQELLTEEQYDEIMTILAPFLDE